VRLTFEGQHQSIEAGKPDQDQEGRKAGTVAERKESFDAAAKAARPGSRAVRKFLDASLGIDAQPVERTRGHGAGGRTNRLGVDGKG
jgi:hypothetical protein